MTIKTVPGTVISLGLSLCVEVGGGSGGQHDIMGTPLRGTAWYGGQLWCNMVNCTVNKLTTIKILQIFAAGKKF